VEVFNGERLVICLVPAGMIQKRETFERYRVKMVAVVSDSQAKIQRAVLLEPGPGQQVLMQISRSVEALLTHGIAIEIHWVPGLSGYPRNEYVDCQANLGRKASRATVMERPNNSGWNRDR